jgi:hypothetical protein
MGDRGECVLLVGPTCRRSITYEDEQLDEGIDVSVVTVHNFFLDSRDYTSSTSTR